MARSGKGLIEAGKIYHKASFVSASSFWEKESPCCPIGNFCLNFKKSCCKQLLELVICHLLQVEGDLNRRHGIITLGFLIINSETNRFISYKVLGAKLFLEDVWVFLYYLSLEYVHL